MKAGARKTAVVSLKLVLWRGFEETATSWKTLEKGAAIVQSWDD